MAVPTRAEMRVQHLEAIDDLIRLRWCAAYSDKQFGNRQAHLDRIDDLLDERNKLTKKAVDMLATTLA